MFVNCFYETGITISQLTGQKVLCPERLGYTPLWAITPRALPDKKIFSGPLLQVPLLNIPVARNAHRSQRSLARRAQQDFTCKSF